MSMPLEQLKEIKQKLKQQQTQLNKNKDISNNSKKSSETTESLQTLLNDQDVVIEDPENAWEKFIQNNQDIKIITQKNYVTLENIPEISEDALKNRRKSAVTETIQEIHEFSNQFVKYLDPNDLVGFRKDGIQFGVYAKVKHGEYPIKARLDLHKHTLEQARSHTENFLNFCYEKGFRFVIIVHGKGEFTSPKAFLKSHVFSWMKQSQLVLAAHSAMPYHGGAGALYVLLKKNENFKFQNREKYL